MGLFDKVKCEYPLPDPAHQDLAFQTKDLGCLLESYTVTRDGRLLRHARSDLLTGGPTRDVEWPFHGDVRLYHSLERRDGSREWIEYELRFTHGRVESARRIGPEDEGDWPLAERERQPPEAPAPGADASVDRPLTPPLSLAQLEAAEGELLRALREQAQELKALLERCSDHWHFEDPVYRFYHQSFKVFDLQYQTESIVARLAGLVPERPLNPWFQQIVREGTGRSFRMQDNADWIRVTRPILEAFFHARFFLEMAVRYAPLEAPPRPLPSGYAALLYLYGLR